MKRMMVFARRNAKEILRDPISMCFGIIFPVVLLALLSLINNAIPEEGNVSIFSIENLAPDITAFGLCFLSLFASMLIAKDRCSSFMLRLRTSPLRSWQYIVGYSIPMLPMALVQSVICMLAAIPMGAKFSFNIFAMAVGLLPTACLYIALGLLAGSVLSEKAVGGVCGALLTNVSGWLSGTFFSIELIGGAYEKICKILPFYPSAKAAKALLEGRWADAIGNIGIVSAWAIVAAICAILVFTKKMKSDK